MSTHLSQTKMSPPQICFWYRKSSHCYKYRTHCLPTSKQMNFKRASRDSSLKMSTLLNTVAPSCLNLSSIALEETIANESYSKTADSFTGHRFLAFDHKPIPSVPLSIWLSSLIDWKLYFYTRLRHRRLFTQFLNSFVKTIRHQRR